MVAEQDSFQFLEAALHASECDRISGTRSLILTGEERALVLECMARAAQIARQNPMRTSRPTRKHTPPPAEVDLTPIVVSLPLNSPDDEKYNVHESVLPAMRKAYPLVDVIQVLKRVAFEWGEQPKIRPTPIGAKRALAWQLGKAQDWAERRAHGYPAPSGGTRPASAQYVPGGPMEPKLLSEIKERERQREAVMRRESQKRAESGSGRPVIDSLFGGRKA